MTYRKSSIKRPLSNKRLPPIKRPPLEQFCTKHPSLISAPPLISTTLNHRMYYLLYETHTPLKLKPLCYICVITNITLQVHNKVYEIREENLSIWFRKLNKRPSLISAPLLISAPPKTSEIY